MCWIGLELFKNKFNNITYQWSDGSNINKTFIKNNLCKGYKNILNNNSSYYVYINTNLNCWNITFSTTLVMHFICGPKMFDSTGYYYWILRVYIPAILFFFGTIYAIYIFVSLRYNLYIFEHNWLLQPTKAIIRTAILLPAIISVIFVLLIIYYVINYLYWLL